MSAEGKALINKMLVLDPKRRITAERAIKEPWFTKCKHIEIGCDEDKLDPNIVQNLREYKGVSALKKVAMNILVKMADNKDIEHLRELFVDIDKDSTGFITVKELKAVMNQSNINIDDTELDNIIDEMDYGGDKRVNYSEFLAATISVKKILTDEKLNAIFKQFNTDGNGIICP